MYEMLRVFKKYWYLLVATAVLFWWTEKGIIIVSFIALVPVVELEIKGISLLTCTYIGQGIWYVITMVPMVIMYILGVEVFEKKDVLIAIAIVSVIALVVSAIVGVQVRGLLSW